jgi:hypothetical protein
MRYRDLKILICRMAALLAILAATLAAAAAGSNLRIRQMEVLKYALLIVISKSSRSGINITGWGCKKG